MSQGKRLFKNTMILSLGMLCPKILTFLLLPLYTYKISPAEYGVVDLLISLLGVITPVVSLQLSNGVFRYLIQERNDNEKKKIVTTCFVVEFIGLIFVTMVIYLFSLAFCIPYREMFIIYLWVYVISDYVLNITRGLGHNDLFSFSSALFTLISLASNLVLILRLGLGGEAILFSHIIAFLIKDFFLIIKLGILNLFSITAFSRTYLSKILGYSVALIPDAVSWWISNTSDRLIIVHFLGSSMNGIYAVANKFPAIFTTIFHVFELAWTESVSRNIDEGRSPLFIIKTLQTSVMFVTFLIIVVITMVGVMFDVFVGNDYISAYNHCLILLVSAYFSAICSLFGGIFIGYKETSLVAKTTMVSAVVNVTVNLLLINWIGLYAASISTLISYFVLMVVRWIMISKFITLTVINKTTVLLGMICASVCACYIMRNYWVMCLLSLFSINIVYSSNKELFMKICKTFWLKRCNN